MLDPEIIPSLRRRIAAFAIDFGLVAVLTALVGRSRFQEFKLERTPGTDQLLPTFEQFEAISKLAEGFNRKFYRGDSLFVIDGMGVLLTLLVGAVLSIIFFVAVPANTGWSPGKRLFGLRVIDTDGGTPTLLAFFARSIVGLIDLLPVVVPGLLGFFLASRHSDGHRLGDRIAGTTVVDARRPVRFVDPAVMERRAALQIDEQEPADDETMVDLGDRLGSTAADPAPTPGLAAASPPRARDLLETTVRSPADPDPVESAQPISRPEPQGEAPSRARPQSAPRPQVEGPGSHLPAASTTERQSSGHPPPTHRGSTGDAGQRRPISASEARTWEPPVAEPAPVWVVGAPVPNQAETPPTVVGVAATQAQPAAIQAGRTESSATDPEVAAPVWNEQWQAWLFWDADGHRWLRHDEASGVWVPIS